MWSGSEANHGISVLKAPLSMSTMTSRAIMVPLASRAVRIATTAFSRLGHVNKSSARVLVIFTGRPVSLAANAANGSSAASSLAPNPPPIVCPTTRTSETRTPINWATRSRTLYGNWTDA